MGDLGVYRDCMAVYGGMEKWKVLLLSSGLRAI